MATQFDDTPSSSVRFRLPEKYRRLFRACGRELESVDPLWAVGLAVAVLFVAAKFFPTGGRSHDWTAYLAMGVLYPVCTLGLAVLFRGQAASRWTLGLKCALVAAACAGMIALWIDGSSDAPLLTPLALAAVVPYAMRRRTNDATGLVGWPSICLLFLLSTASWIAAVRLLYWGEFVQWILTSFRHAVGFLAAAFLCIAAVFGNRRGPLPAVWQWIGHVGAFCLFVFLSFRTDGLVHPDITQNWGFAHHWGFWVGPAESVREGAWLLWDIPSQYGFLSILTLAMMPIDNVWEALFVLQGILLTIFAVPLYAMFVRWGRTVWHYLFAVTATMCCVFFVPGIPQSLSGPQPWLSVGPMRFLWFYLAIAWAWLCLEREPGLTRGRIVWGSLVWTLGMLWSFESAVFCSVIFCFAFGVAALQKTVSAYRETGRALRCAKAVSPFVVVPAGCFLAAFSAVMICYWLRFGHGPDWRSYWEYSFLYIGLNPQKWSSPVGNWVILFTVAGVIAMVIGRQFKADPLHPRLVMGAAAWAAIWAGSSYYVTKNNEGEVDHLMPVMAMVLALAVPLADAVSDSSVSRLIRHAVFPIFVVVIAMTVGNSSLPGVFLTPQQARSNVTALLTPPLEKTAIELLESSGVTPETPLASNYIGRMLPMPFRQDPERGKAEIFSRSWLPKPLVMLRALPEERQAQYIQRMLTDQARGGWLLTQDASFEQKWDRIDIAGYDQTLIRLVEPHCTVKRVAANVRWTLWWCEPKPVAPASAG